jgi:hypothetical protein
VNGRDVVGEFPTRYVCPSALISVRAFPLRFSPVRYIRLNSVHWAPQAPTGPIVPTNCQRHTVAAACTSRFIPTSSHQHAFIIIYATANGDSIPSNQLSACHISRSALQPFPSKFHLHSARIVYAAANGVSAPSHEPSACHTSRSASQTIASHRHHHAAFNMYAITEGNGTTPQEPSSTSSCTLSTAPSYPTGFKS